MSIRILPTSDQIRSDLGNNPHPQALAEHAEFYLGAVPPPLIQQENRYPYVITVKTYDNQDNFYDEMESLGSRGFIPTRVVECVDRMPVCRSTTYSLTPAEAEILKNDPRIHAVELDPKLRGHVVRPLNYEYSDGWDKSGTTTSNMKNWALLRGTNQAQIPGWGSDGTPNQIAQIVTTSTGKNVDSVVFDGNINPNHPEYAVNADGSGGSRVNQFNWWSLNERVTGDPNGTYDYTAGAAGNNGHGFHVAGIMAGNSCGWARDSTIFNISPYGEQTNGTATPSLTQLVNYIKIWNREAKAINPATGRKNPTVVNMSFGLFGNFFPAYTDGNLYVNQLVYRGVTTAYPSSAPAGQTSIQQTYMQNWTVQNFLDAGIQLFQGYIDAYGIALYFYTVQDASADAAILDAADEGIIFCAAMGNSYDLAGYYPGHPNYDNNFNQLTGFFKGIPLYAQRFHNRPSTPQNAQSGTFGTDNYKQICCVGNIGTLTNEQLSETSSSGAKVNIWAPGENIMSAYISAGVADPRNPAYFLAKLTGTSMASPQVAGIMACAAELFPNMSNKQAIQYVQQWAQNGIIPDPNIPLPPFNSYYNLREGANKFLIYNYDRPVTGNPWPQEKFWLRPSSGAVYPRPNIQRTPVYGVSKL
jgi:hypothetical protein